MVPMALHVGKGRPMWYGEEMKKIFRYKDSGNMRDYYLTADSSAHAERLLSEEGDVKFRRDMLTHGPTVQHTRIMLTICPHTRHPMDARWCGPCRWEMEDG